MKPEGQNDRALDLRIDGNDISRYVGDWANCGENRTEWTVHTELTSNNVTANLLRPLTKENRKVWIEYKMRGRDWPWRSGRAAVAWRITEKGTEELILHGLGRLGKERTNSSTKPSDTSIPAKVTKVTLLGGKVIQREEGIGSIELTKEDPQERAFREAQLRLTEEAEIQAVTSPGFVLFLANSALSSFRLLHSTAMSEGNSKLLYPSLIFLPLSTEYFLKYLLLKRTGTFKKEYKTHKLLTLFDFLPFDTQKAIDEDFKNELENIGWERTSEDLRVFLRRTEDAFTSIRYLFDSQYAKDSRHLLNPENIVVLACVSNALERVSKQL